MFIEIFTIDELKKRNILVLILSVRFWILNYCIFIWIKRIPKIQTKKNHSSLKLQQHFLINCTQYEVQWCPLHKIKLNFKIFLISIFMYMFLKYLNFCLKNIKGIYNNYDHENFSFFIWNTFISSWKIRKGFSIFVTIVIKPIMDFFFHFLFEILIFLLEELDARFSNVYYNHDKAYHWKFSFFIFNILISALIYIKDFQIFITIMIKPIMEFLPFHLKYFYSYLKERKGIEKYL
jgi:hypothetical protein